MEIELGGMPKYDSVRSNAYWTRVHLDTSFLPDADDAMTYKAHLQDCIDNPTVGFLARRKYITRKPLNYPECAWRNEKVMEKFKDANIKRTKSYLESIVSQLYPKTKHIRKYIINKDRVVLDEVKRAKKYTMLDKLMILISKYK